MLIACLANGRCDGRFRVTSAAGIVRRVQASFIGTAAGRARRTMRPPAEVNGAEPIWSSRRHVARVHLDVLPMQKFHDGAVARRCRLLRHCCPDPATANSAGSAALHLDEAAVHGPSFCFSGCTRRSPCNAWYESGAREPFSLFRFCVARVNKKQPFRRAFDENNAPYAVHQPVLRLTRVRHPRRRSMIHGLLWCSDRRCLRLCHQQKKPPRQ